MAADYIKVNKGLQLGSSLVMLADRMREVRELVDKLKDAANHQFAGSDYAMMEERFGLQSGAGANTITLLNIMHGILNTNETVAGDTRVSQIEEFVSRLSGQ